MIQRIAIFRALQLGDLLLAVPALRAIRHRFPTAEITLIGLPWAASFVDRYACYLNRFVEFVGYPGIAEIPLTPESSARVEQFLAEQRAYGYDLVVQMHGSGQTSNPFVLALHGRMTVGYYDGTSPAGLSLHAQYPHDQHEIFRNLGLAALLGSTHLSPRLEFPLTSEDHAEAATLLQGVLAQRRPLIALHPGARPPARRWPVAYFASLADMLAQRFDAQIVFTGGPGEEATVQTVIDLMHTRPLNLAGKTSLGGLAALIQRVSLCISNDTGPAHVACAVDTPSIILFGPADFARWSPLDATRHTALRHPVACSPCGYWECPIDHRCLRGLSPETVFVTAQRYLQPFPMSPTVPLSTIRKTR